MFNWVLQLNCAQYIRNTVSSKETVEQTGNNATCEICISNTY